MKKLTQKSLPESARPVWPLDAPGLSAPGPALLALAAARGSEYALAGKRGSAGLARYDGVLADIVRDALYQAGKVAVNIRLGSTHSTRVVVSGHRWGSGIVRRNGVVGTLPADGPCPCRVLVIGKMVSETGAEDLRHFSDDAGRLLVETLRKYDYTGEADWYVTSALKIADPGESSSSLKAAWISEFDHLFQQELRLVKPDFILCVGSDALKAVLGKKATLEKARGVVQTLTVDMRRKASEPSCNHVVQVMACEHPNSVMRDDRKRPRFELDVARFIKLLSGAEPNAAEEGLDHRIIRDERELIAVIRHAEANNPSRIVAVDAEWHGQHPQNEGAYLRCMQFSWAHKAAACVALHAPGGEPSFKILVRDKNNKPLVKNGRPVWTTAGGMQRAFQLLTKYFVNKRVVGHFLNADLEWLVHFGLDLREQFAAPADWTKCRTVGGWDTGSMAHATEETGIFNLTDQSLRHTTAPRYDVALDAWKAEFCRSRGLKASQLEGYGECPEEILYPYALFDADTTRRIALRYAKKLDCDEFGNNCWEAFWITQRASPAALEITRTGLLVNRERLDRLTTVYMQARDNLARKIRTWARWPELKLNSAHHIRELLYGEQFNEPDADGRVRRHRPRGALSLYAMPTITTGKRPRPWEAVIGTPAEKTSTPSTNKSALGILFRESDKMRVWSPRRRIWQVKDCGKYIEDIRNYRFVNQTLQSVLARPVEAEDADDFDDPFEVDEDGNFVYEARLPGAICTDNRVRTFISQLKETGRWSSSRPPLMNLGAKRRELDYKQILGESYEYPLRSIFEADEGFTLVESDYIGAELFGMAILSGDTTMINHALRNQLPEDHPDYFDIHSSMASLAFQLGCAPTKAALQALGKSHLRAVAKAILFGLAYGRGAKAVALAVREEGIHISVDEAQQVIDTIFATYPLLVPFFAECRARVVCRDRRTGPAPRWLCGALGRFRRFPYTTDRELMADFERQAMNFPLQNMVADAVSRAADHLLTVRRRRRLGFKFALQIHDALLFLVPNHEVPVFIDEVLPLCMTKLVPIYPCHLDGRPKKGTKAYSLGIDTEVYRYWGVGMSPRDCQERSVPEKYAGWHKSELFPGGWESHKAPRSVWLARTGKSHPFITGQTKSMLKEDAYRQAIDLGRLPEPAEPVVKAMKSMKDAELVKLLGL